MYGCSKREEDEWVAVAGMGADGLNWQRGIASYQAEVSSQLFSWLRVISTFTLFYCYPGLFYQIPNLRSRVPILFFFPPSLLRKSISIRCCYIAVISALQQISLWPSVLWLQVLLMLSSLSIDFKAASPSSSILPLKAHKPNWRKDHKSVWQAHIIFTGLDMAG